MRGLSVEKEPQIVSTVPIEEEKGRFKAITNRLFDKDKPEESKSPEPIVDYDSPYSDTQEAASFLLKKVFNTLNNFPALSHGPDMRNTQINDAEESKDRELMIFSSFESLLSLVQVDSDPKSKNEALLPFLILYRSLFTYVC